MLHCVFHLFHDKELPQESIVRALLFITFMDEISKIAKKRSRLQSWIATSIKSLESRSLICLVRQIWKAVWDGKREKKKAKDELELRNWRDRTSKRRCTSIRILTF